MLVPIPASVTLVVVTETPGGRDPYGNDRRVGSETPYAGCAWWSNATSEDDEGRLTVTTGRTALLPDAAVVAASSRVRFPDGSLWQVQGDPAPQWSPITGFTGGILVLLQRVTG
jgi:hypothetical protein